MADYPKVTVLLTILVIVAALFSGMFYLGRTPSSAVDKAKPAHAFISVGK